MTSEKSNIRVVFAGGGTGGHIYPAVAIYESLLERLGGDGVEALFVGVKGGLESSLLSDRDVKLRLLPGRGVRGASLATKLLVPFDLARGVATGVRTIRNFRPDLVIGTGGYASVSMVVAAILTGTPRILQEQNSVLGLVNRRLARFADLILLSYEQSLSAMPAGLDTVVIGNPLRRMLSSDRETGTRHFGLDPGRPTVLVVGGSRGARSLNVATVEAARELIEESDAQFLLLTGVRDYEATARSLVTAGIGADRVVARAYSDDIYHAYAAADVAVARAGASSVFELASYGVPTVFVPYPYAADDHQRLNAEPLRECGGAVIVTDAELSGKRLANELREFLRDEPRRAGMSDAMRSWAKDDAAAVAADYVVDLVKKKAVAGIDRRPIRRGVRRSLMTHGRLITFPA
jgi:UDP-N-acetylglucosamine--N-acetylmuramyl-(pentapeptide) pyrophosphoryl-undecaprenol N-acetylglucosamine transferase